MRGRQKLLKYNVHSPFKHVVKTLRYKHGQGAVQQQRIEMRLVVNKVRKECASIRPVASSQASQAMA
jgi:hypothetical protein